MKIQDVLYRQESGDSAPSESEAMATKLLA